MSLINHTWLVEIRLKDWRADIEEFANRTVTHVEVNHQSEFGARFSGIDMFIDTVKASEEWKEKFKKYGLTFNDIYAPSAVII